jgi:hypothetical protein
MSKARLAVLLGGAYALGLVLLVGVAMALPCGKLTRFHSAVRQAPTAAQHAARLAQVAVRAGSLGVKHLPAVLESQGVFQRKRSIHLCHLQGSGANALPQLQRVLLELPLPSVRAFFLDDEG